MFFVFESGNPQDGEAAGGLGDMQWAFDSLDDAKAFAEVSSQSSKDVEILNGVNGDTIQKGFRQEGWFTSPCRNRAYTTKGSE
jgi:hypothetical protein